MDDGYFDGDQKVADINDRAAASQYVVDHPTVRLDIVQRGKKRFMLDLTGVMKSVGPDAAKARGWGDAYEKWAADMEKA